jgi:AsmA protein
VGLAGDNDRPLFARLSLTGDFSCRELQYDNTIVRDLVSHLQGTAGNFVFAPVTFQAFGGTATGKVEADMGGEGPLVGMHLELSRFRAEDFFASLTKEELLHGEMELTLDITARGAAPQELLRSISGKASMTGRTLTSTRFDLDNLLEEFIQSQRFDLVDLGAFLIVGPLGPTLTKGFDFGMAAGAVHGGSTEVRQLVSLWQIDQGRAVTRDVALATEKSRLAMSGEVDIAAHRFRNLVVAVVDAGGCALVRQEIDGPFENPQVKKPSFLESAAGPLLNIFKGTAKLITGEKCEVFYNGSVAAPRK